MAEIPDYNLGRAHGKIEIDYQGDGADKAARDLDKVAAESAKADQSLTKTQKTLRDTGKEFDTAGTSANGYGKRIHDLDQAHTGLHKSHAQTGQDLDDFSKRAEKAGDSAGALSEGLHVAADAMAAAGGEFDGASEGLEALSKGFSHVGSAADAGGQHVRDFARHIADFEKSTAKISGIALGGGALAGLGGLAGGAAVQGLTAMVDSVRQLSGALGLLPAAIAGVGVSMGTLKVAFHGVSDALKDMMADDPKKFLEDIKNMGPVAAQSMLQIAQFRNAFKMAGASIQDSFFKQIAGDIAPLIQTWLPAVTAGMSKIATLFGQAAHQFAGLLEQPAMMQAFQQFISNLAAGMQALQPAMVPLLDIFTRLTTVGSGFFGEIGQRITQMMGFFDQIVAKAQASGQLQQWIQTGIDAFSHLVNIAYLVGSSFNTIMDVAEKFGGGGFLGWLQQVTGQFDAWTKSAAGQNVLQQFFATTQQAMTAFAPMIAPIAQGVGSLLTAFTKLGVGIAPGWQVFFDTFAQTMGQLGPQIVALAPTLNQFLVGLSGAFSQLMASVGPQLPQIFQGLAGAFLALLPQIGPLVDAFLQLVEQVGPQLPQFFGAITGLIQASLPFWPIIIGFVRDFVSALTWFIGAGAAVTNWFTGFLGSVRNFVTQIPAVFGPLIDGISGFFKNLPGEAEQWGKDLINGFIGGIKSLAGDIDRVVKSITDHIPSVVKKALGISSPSKVFHEIGVNMMQGLQQGLGSEAGKVIAATGSIANQAVAAASSAVTAAGAAAAGASGLGGAPAPAAGGSDTTGRALLPDNIAGADVSILRAYEKHKFDDKRGLKGLAASLGQALTLSQTGFNLLNQYVVQSLLTGMNMAPGSKDKTWQKMTPGQQAAQLRDNAAKDQPNGPTWADALGAASPGAATAPSQTPLGLTSTSSKEDIQKAIIAAGKQRGMSDPDIQTALAVAAAESGFDPTISGGVQGSAGLVSGLFQQSPSSGWGTLDQVNDPNHAINAFYNAYALQLAKNPNNPLLAAVLTQNPQLGSGAQGSAYMTAVQNKLGLAGSILNAPGNKDIKGPSWAQVAPGSAAIPGMSLATGAVPGLPVAPPDKIKVGQDGSISVPPGYSLPPSPVGGAGKTIDASTLPEGLAPTKNLSPNAELLNRAVTAAFGDQLRALGGGIGGWRADDSGSGEHSSGGALDILLGPLGQKNPQQQALGTAINAWLQRNAGAFGLNWSIFQQHIQNAGQAPEAMGDRGSITENHFDHVHAYTGPTALGGPGTATKGTGLFYMPDANSPLIPVQPGTSGDPSGGLVTPGGKTLDQLTDNTGKSATANDRLLQAYLQGNPALASQIDAARQPGAPDTVVLGALNGISKTIDGLKTQDAVGNKSTIDALQSTQSDIASQQGYTSGQSALSSVQGALGGAAQAITGGFQVVQGVLDAMAATQDIADRLVYGVANTEDVMKLIDDSQKYIALAADVANETGNVLSAVGGVVGAAGSGAGPGGGSAGSALSMAGTVAQLIGGTLQGINMGIDYAQQVYEIAMNYFGQFMSYLTAGPNGTPLMGNVQYMLNTNTGKLITSSLDNPQKQNQLTVPALWQAVYGMGGGNSNPTMGDLNIYAGPGQSPAAMMNEAMWQVNTGNVGAAVAANF